MASNETVKGIAIYPEKDEKWWKEAVIYQVWPHSFCDASGQNGVGNLAGVTSKLDYLQNLGVNVVWLSPVFSSPFVDAGYDVSDYRNINHLYGTLTDWDHLKDELHKRGMKIVMDLVINHCSDEHPWFVDACKSRDSPYRDYFYWGDRREGEIPEPNNWASIFAGPSWTWREDAGQYYYHAFASAQPDLNWGNPKVREEMHNIMRFWTDRGCDGMRLDACTMLSKPEGLPDAPIVWQNDLYQPANVLVEHGEHIFDYYTEMCSLFQDDIMIVGEMAFTPPPLALQYVHPAHKRIHMIFTFDHMLLDRGPRRLEWAPFPFVEFKKITEYWQTYMSENGGWNSIYLSNHDQPRPVSRFADDSPEYRDRGSKMLALMEATLGGTLYIYQGEELGLKNYPEDFDISLFPDVATQNHLKTEFQALKEGRSDMHSEEEIVHHTRRKARDNARGPMPWDASKPNGGFSDVKPWFVMNPDDAAHDAASQVKWGESVYSFWKELLDVRRSHKTLIYGGFKCDDIDHPTIWTYTRFDTEKPQEARYFVALNFSGGEVEYSPPGMEGQEGRVLVGNVGGKTGKAEGLGRISLEGWEGRLYEMK